MMRGIVVAVVLFVEICIVTGAQKITCGGTGAFNGFIGVFERKSGKLTGFSPQCSEGTLNVGEEQGIPNHFPYQTQWFGQEWSIKTNEKYELRQANCPHGEVLKGFLEWRNGDESSIMGLRVVCSLSSADFDYIIDLYQEQGKYIAQNNQPQSQNICLDMITTINYEKHERLRLASNIQCQTDAAVSAASDASQQKETMHVSPIVVDPPQETEFTQTEQNSEKSTQDPEKYTTSSTPSVSIPAQSSPTQVQPPYSDAFMNAASDAGYQKEAMHVNPVVVDPPQETESTQSTQDSQNYTPSSSPPVSVAMQSSPPPVKLPYSPSATTKGEFSPTMLSAPILEESNDMEPITEIEDAVIPPKTEESPTPMNSKAQESPQKLNSPKPKKNRRQKVESSPALVESTPEEKSSPVLVESTPEEKSPSPSASNVHPQYAMLQQRKSPMFYQYQAIEPQNNAVSEEYQFYEAPSSVTASTLISTSYVTNVPPPQISVAPPLPAATISAPVETMIQDVYQYQTEPTPTTVPTPSPTPTPTPAVSQLIQQPNVPVTTTSSEK